MENLENFNVGIKIKLEDDKASKQIEILQAKLDKIKQENQVKMELMTKESSARIEKLQMQMKNLQDMMNKRELEVQVKTDKASAQYQALIDKMQQMKELHEQELSQNNEKHLAQMELMKAKLEAVKQKTEEVANASKKTLFSQWEGAFKGVLQNAIKLTYALLTVRGVWFAIRKAMTTYLSNNEELQSRLNAIYYGVGSLFAPLLEFLVTKLEQALNIIDNIARALGFAGTRMNEFYKKTGKAINQLLAFDEINNLKSNGSGNEEVYQFQQMDVSLHRVGAWLGIIASTLALMKRIGKLESIDQIIQLFKQDWKKMIGIGAIFVGLGTAIGSFLDYLKDPNWQSFGEMIAGIGLAIVGLATLIGNIPLLVAGGLVIAFGILVAKWDDIRAWWDENKQKFPDWVQNIGDDVIETLDGIFNKIRDWFDKLIEMIKNKDIAGAIEHAFGGWFTYNGKGLFNIEKTLETGVPTIDANNIGDAIKSGIQGAKQSTFYQSAEAVGKWIANKINGYDVGTNYVPNDQLAMIHKGEAIVPAKYNNADLYGNVSAEQLNLLSGIYEMVENINRKDFDISLDGQSVANKVRTINDQNAIRNGNRVFAIER